MSGLLLRRRTERLIGVCDAFKYNLLAFFLPVPSPDGHDDVGLFKRFTRRSSSTSLNDRKLEGLGLHASEWTNSVGRAKDMELYMWRLVLGKFIPCTALS